MQPKQNQVNQQLKLQPAHTYSSHPTFKQVWIICIWIPNKISAAKEYHVQLLHINETNNKLKIKR